jgi:prepilin-type N-terminal cleavage/methylation domain-containing protein
MHYSRIASPQHRQRTADGVVVSSERGFSLIELLVVISIIGILTTIVLASLSQARARGRDARRVADIRQLQLALELYYDANGSYPLTLSVLSGPGYIPAVPKDPGNGYDYAYVALTGAGINGACASYHLAARLEIYSAGAGSSFLDDADQVPGTNYPTDDGAVCNGSAWGGNGSADPNYIPSSNGDFNGSNDAITKAYDVRP